MSFSNTSSEDEYFLAKQTHYVNSLSTPEMESLIAICDTFLPSILDNESATVFYQTSASMAATPELIGGIMSERLKHPKLWLMRIALWMLSTRVGSFAICGRSSLSTEFPYLQKFCQLSIHKREHILKAWSTHFLSLLRIFFKAMKFLTLLVFFTQVDDKGENLSWKAIGYCGPDPNFNPEIKQTSTSTKIKGPQSEDSQVDQEHILHAQEEHYFGPLHKGIINLNPRRDTTVVEKLNRLGFPVVNKQNKKSSISNPYMVIRCDAVVVGSGSGGGVAAGVLAKAGYKVIVLEKGKYCARTSLSLLEGPTMDQMYLSGGMLASNDMNAVILAGSTVGGGSTINWSASFQTPQHVVHEWSDHHKLKLFNSELYREAQKVVCEKMGVQSEFDEEGFNNGVLRRGCEKMGYPITTIPRNSPSDHYCGWCCLGCKDGRKKGTSETWLVELVDSGNGVILPGCEAIKVLHKREKGQIRNTATGVAFNYGKHGENEICIIESKVTIVACGALCTPHLLKKSGLKNPNIGKNLHLHPVTMAWGHFPNTKKNSYEGGIMTAMSTIGSNFDTSGYGAVIQTPALHPGMFSAMMPWTSGLDIKNRMCRFSKTAHVFALARDKGSGTVINPDSISYKLDVIDEENLQKGLETVLRILAAAGAEEIGTHHFKGRVLNLKKESEQEFERFVKEESVRVLKDFPAPVFSAHQMGSCRMGVEPTGSAVNHMGETWEVEGLYVADTSVFPTALGINPMVTVQAIAYCTAKSVIEDLRRRKST